MIVCKDLSKNFRAYQKDPGILGSVRSFFNRRYTDTAAVDSFTCSVAPGEFVGLLGPNGAGKTTLMKMFAGLIAPSSGSVEVLGSEPFARSIEFRRSIALVMGQKSQLWPDIPALDSFELLQAYYEISDRDFHDRLSELGELLDVTRLLKVQIRKLSLGERMKMELMACLLHNPKVLFLDEPTIGLDLVAQRNIREFLTNYQKRHATTVVLTSHYMADVVALCDRILLIIGGKKLFDGPIAHFERLLGRDLFVTVTFQTPQPADDSLLARFSPVWDGDGRKVELRIAEGEFREVAQQILARFPVLDFTTEALPVERVMHSVLSNPELLQGQQS
jgi:ABC-2 type transport system ATP-binding protein